MAFLSTTLERIQLISLVISLWLSGKIGFTLGYHIIHASFSPLKRDEYFLKAYARLSDAEKQQVDEMFQLAVQEDVSEK